MVGISNSDSAKLQANHQVIIGLFPGPFTLDYIYRHSVKSTKEFGGKSKDLDFG